MYFLILLQVIISKEDDLVPNEIENGKKNTYREYERDELARNIKNREHKPSGGFYDDSFSDSNDIQGLKKDEKNMNDNNLNGFSKDDISKMNNSREGILNDDLESISSKESKKGNLNNSGIFDDDYSLLPEYVEDCKEEPKDELDISKETNIQDAKRDEIFQLDDKEGDMEDIAKRISDLSIQASEISSDIDEKRTPK